MHLSEALVDTLQDDTGLLRQRHDLATMEIQGADESILIRPGSCTAQGSEGAADAFHRVYHKRIDKWSDHLRAELLQKALIFKAPPSAPDLFNSPVFMVLTTYADDVRVTSITTELVHTWSRVMANNAALDNALDEMPQNTAKQEHSVFFAGQRAREYMASLDGTGVCFLARQDQLLGTLALTSTSWAAFDPVVSGGRPTPSSAPFFQALVVSILYTGLEALRLRFPDYEYLDRFVLDLGRKTMRGKATISTKLEDGTEKKRTVDRKKVWDFLVLVPSATELRARRLQRYQDLMKDPTEHQNVLLSFFGEAPFASSTIFEENGRVRESACGGARQWQEKREWSWSV